MVDVMIEYEDTQTPQQKGYAAADKITHLTYDAKYSETLIWFVGGDFVRSRTHISHLQQRIENWQSQREVQK